MRPYTKLFRRRICYKFLENLQRPLTTCTRCNAPLTRPVRPKTALQCTSSAIIVHKRTLFNIFDTKDDIVHKSAQNPGVTVIATLSRYLHENIGFEPNTNELIMGFSQLSKQASVLNVPGNVFGLAELMEVLSKRGALHLLPRQDVSDMLEHLKEVLPRDWKEYDIKLAEYLFHYLLDVSDTIPKAREFRSFVFILSLYGEIDLAKIVAKNGFQKYGAEVVNALTYFPIMTYYQWRKNEEQLLAVWDEVAGYGLKMSPKNYQAILELYMTSGQHEKVQKWYQRMVHEGTPMSFSVYQSIFTYYSTKAFENSKDDANQQALRWSNDLFMGFLNGMSSLDPHKTNMVEVKKIWHLALRWCLARGKSVDDIDRLMRIAKDAHLPFEPDITTINFLLRYAIDVEDAYLAERLYNLGQKWRFDPNRKTWQRMVEYRLMAGDLEGARVAWDELKYCEAPTDDDGSETKMLLRALCNQSNRELSKIKDIYDEVLERKIPLDIDTLLPLLTAYLDNSDIETFVHVLTRDVLTYTPDDRIKVVHHILNHIRKDTTNRDEAWELYGIVKEVFLELTRDQRTEIMRLFFAQGRPDMGTMVFSHMRHSAAARPTEETYIECIRQIESYNFADGLFRVHGFLKIDPNVEPSTKIYNALMHAYCMCGQAKKAMEVYDLIMSSSEGPDQRTIDGVMLASGFLTDGMVEGRKIWDKFYAMGWKPDVDNHAFLIKGIMMGEGEDKGYEYAKSLEKVYGVRPNWQVLWSVYNYIHPKRAQEVQDYFQSRYPREWQDLENYPDNRLHDRRRQYQDWLKKPEGVMYI